MRRLSLLSAVDRRRPPASPRPSLAQRGPAPDPLVKENATVKLAPHTYVIPDGNVGLVPNVGIVVGSRATLVIDPGLGRRNGEAVLREVAKVSKNTELYIASTHFHRRAHDRLHRISPHREIHQLDGAGSRVRTERHAMVQTFSKRSEATAEILKDAARRPAAITFDSTYTLDLGGVRVRFMVVGPTHTKGDTGFFVEGDNVLFAGDVVMNNSFLAASAVSSMKAWLAAFDTFEALKPQTIVPAHGEVGTGHDHRHQPQHHAGRPGARPRAQGRGADGGRHGEDGAGGVSGATSGVAARERPCRRGQVRLRGSAVTGTLVRLKPDTARPLLLLATSTRIDLERRLNDLFLSGRPQHFDAVDRLGGAEPEVQRVEAVRQVARVAVDGPSCTWTRRR